MDYIANQLGLPTEFLAICSCLVSSFPLALLYNHIPKSNPILRHWFCFLSTSSIIILLFGVTSYLNVLVPTLITYGLTSIAGGDRLVPILVSVGVIVQLFILHVQIQLLHANDLTYVNISTPMMVMAIKLSLFAWSVYDGTRSTKDLDSDMVPFAIKEMPDLIEYLGFIFYFATFWVGPAFDYQYYYEYTRSIGPYTRKSASLNAGLRVLGLGILMMIMFVTVDTRWGASALFNGPFFTNYTVLERIGVVQLTGFSVRAKFAAAWKLSEAAAILTGLGSNGIDPKTNQELHDRLDNVDILQVELGQSPKQVVDGWNKKTAGWLKRCVYLRIIPFAPTAVATGVTNLVSAFWHGVYPGFYLAFGSGTFIVLAGRTLRRHLRPLFVAEKAKFKWLKPVYDFFGFVFTMSVLNYLFTSFFARWAIKSLQIWYAMYFFGHIGMIAVIGGFWLYDKTSRREHVSEEIKSNFKSKSE
ncbi:Lysophospholipid acyltransferase [Batrachochytrium dendrobatidis]